MLLCIVDNQIRECDNQVKASKSSKKVNFAIPEAPKDAEESKGEKPVVNLSNLFRMPKAKVESEKFEANRDNEVRQDTSPREALKDIFDIEQASDQHRSQKELEEIKDTPPPSQETEFKQ